MCVDLPSSLANTDIGDAHLTLGGGGARIRVVLDGVTQAVVDTRTFAVHSGSFASPLVSTAGSVESPGSAIRADTRDGGDGRSPWWLLAGAAVVAVLGGAAGLRTGLRHSGS